MADAAHSHVGQRKQGRVPTSAPVFRYKTTESCQTLSCCFVAKKSEVTLLLTLQNNRKESPQTSAHTLYHIQIRIEGSQPSL